MATKTTRPRKSNQPSGLEIKPVEHKTPPVKSEAEMSRFFAVTYSMNIHREIEGIPHMNVIRDQIAIASDSFPAGSQIRGHIIDLYKDKITKDLKYSVILEYFMEFKSKEDFDAFQA